MLLLTELSYLIEQSADKYKKMNEDIFMHIYYSTLNFKDVMLASGKI